MRVSLKFLRQCHPLANGSYFHMNHGLGMPSLLTDMRLVMWRCFSSNSMEWRNESWPSAKRQAFETHYHGCRVTDPYSWMKTSGIAKDARNYIDQETRLTEAMIRETKPFQTLIIRRLEELQNENERTKMSTVLGRTVYFRRSYGDSWHYFRRRNCNGRGNSRAELILDTATLTEMYGHPVTISSFKIAPSEDYMAFVVGTTAIDTYDAHIIKTGNDGAKFVDKLEDIFNVEFAHHGVVYYTKLEGLRAAQVWCHHIGQDASQDKMVLEEPDEKYFVDLSHTKDRLYITINSNSTTTSEVHLLDSCKPGAKPPSLVCPRQDGVQYFVEHRQGLLYVLTDGGTDGHYRLVAFPVQLNASIDSLKSSDCLVVFTPEKNCHILDMDVFSDHCVLCVMEGTIPRIVVVPVDAKRQARIIEVPRNLCQITPGPNATCDASNYQFALSSPIHPTTNFCLEIGNGSHLKVVHSQREGNVDESTEDGVLRTRGVCTRLKAESKDGTHVPMTVFHRDDVKLTSSNPMLVCGYGAYGVALDMSYNHHTTLLVECGWVVAYCHVRGGSDLGIQWHHSGRALNKLKSFEDCEACIATLHQAGYSQPSLTALHGTSAGGLLMAAVCNRAPHLVQAAILEVPYIDVLSTMLDHDLPLTQQETEEWGDPLNDPAAFDYIMSYCPYHNITNQKYPAILVTTSLADTRVPVWLPLKYVAKMRHMMSSSPQTHNALYLWVHEESSHFGQLGESDTNEQTAVQTAFLYRTLGLNMDCN